MRASVTSFTKRFISTFFAATLVMGLVPAAAFAANDDTDAAASENSEFAEANSDIQAEAEASAYENGLEDSNDSDPLVIPSVSEESAPAPSVGAEPAPRDGEDETEDNAQASEDDNLAMTIPAATERINEDVMLTTPVAQQETTKNYFLAQTLESTRTVPIVTAQLPLDKGPVDVDIVVEPNAEGEGSGTSEEDGEDSDDPDSEGDLASADDSTAGVISTEASDSERSGEISTPVAAASTVVGSFTYRGITYAVEPGGETVAIVAADYTKLPEDFISAQAIVLPSMVTPDGIDYYSVTRIADYAFSSLTAENCRRLIYVAPDGEDATEDEAAKGDDSNPDSEAVGIDAITVPASVTSIGDNAYTDFNTLQYIIVSDDNPNYSQYDGCLYDKPQSRLLLIPEGRLGAVRVAPSVTEVSPEAFSHCPSVDTLVADPDSAAYRLLEGMDDIDKTVAVSADEVSDFAYVSLGSVETVREIPDLTLLRFGAEASDLMTFLSSCEADGAEILLRNSDVFAEAQVRSYEEPRISNGIRSAFGSYNSTDVSLSQLPQWIQNMLTGIGGSPTFNLVTTEGYSENQSIKNSSSVKSYFTIPLGRYSVVDSSTYNNTPTGTSVTCFAATSNGGYPGAVGSSTTQWFELRYGTNRGIFLAKRGNPAPTTSHRSIVRVNSTSSTTGTIIRCDTALLVKYSSATTPFGSLTASKNYYLFLPPELKVNWNANGGSVTDSSWLVPTATWETDGGILLSRYSNTLPTPTRTNYTFDGWYTAASGGTKISSSTKIYNEGITYYAHWTRDTYTVQYKNKAGSSVLKTDTVNVGDSYSLWGSPTASTGYTAKGWHTSTNQVAAASGYAFNASKTNWKSKGETLTLYLAEAPNTYTVTYNANGGTGNAYTSSHTYGTAKNLSGCSFTPPTGKHFDKWTTNSNGTGTSYTATQSVSNLTTTNGGNVNLYAQWVWNTYTVTYNANGGTGNAYTSSHTYGTAKNLSGCSFTAPTGKHFDKWTTNSNGTGTSYTATQSVSNLTTTNGGNVNLYAQWAWNTYTVTYNANGGTGNAYTSSHIYNTAKNLSGCSFTAPTGKHFDKWTTNSNGTGTSYTATQSVSNLTTTNGGNVNLYAQWVWNTYTVTYNANGGSANANTGNKTTYTSSHVYNTAKNLTTNYFTAPTGKYFTGWNTATNGTGTGYTATQSVSNLTTTNGGNVNLYAQWSWNTYTVTYNPNTGGGSAYTSNHTYNTAQNLSNNRFTAPTGKHFIGWNTQADGKGTAYTETQSVNNLTTTNGGNINLYAQWDNNVYKVRFDPNGGTGGLTGPIDVTYSLAMPTLTGDWKPSLGGYEFNGWWDTDAKTDGKQYYKADGTSANPWNKTDEVTTLYARWSRMPFHAITLKDSRLGDGKDDKSIWYWPSHGFTPSNPNEFPTDGTKDDQIVLVDKDEKITEPISFDDGYDYEFLGWFDKKQGEEGAVKKIDADGTLLTDEVITEAATWYAHWARHGATVELKAAYGDDMVTEDIVEGTKEIKHVAFEKDFATVLDGGIVTEIEKTPTRIGYTFMGYYTEKNSELSTEDVKSNRIKGTRWIYGEGEEDVVAGMLVADEWPSEEYWNKLGLDDEEGTNTIVLYAAWQLDDCIVEFDIESNLEDNTERVYVPEGSTALDDRIWHYNKNMDETLPVPGDATFFRNGYTFGGWYYLDENEDEVRVSAADGTPADVLLPWKSDVEKVTLYAYWTPKTYALEFHPAFPGDEGVEQMYTGEKTIKGIEYDDELTLVSPDFGAYDFAGWYVGVSDGLGSWEASDVPFSDWSLRNGEEVEGLHTTDMVKRDDAAYVTYEGRFTPQDPLVDQTYDAASPEPSVIHVVAKWEKPIPRYIHFYAGLPEESLDASTRDYEPEYYKFATAYPIDPTYLPNVGKDGWKCKGWVEVGSEEEALEYLKSGYVGDEKDPGVTSIEAKTTRAAYKDLYFVAKWTICPLSVTLVTDEDNGTYVKGTDELVDADSWNATPKQDSLYAKVYDVRQVAFTLPNLSRKGYDFKGWVRQGSDDTEPKRDYSVNPADQAKLEANHDLVFEPVFEEIEYTIYLEPNGGGLERQERKAKFTDLFDFSASYPVALHRGSVFECWATRLQKPFEDDGTYREFGITSKVPMSAETEGMEDAPFFLTDLTDDESRTIYLYGIWFGEFYRVDVPLTVNMAVDTETGDVVAAKTTLKPRKGNEDKVYTVESLRYEPVSDERGVPFQGASNVYFSVYPGITFQNDADAYYFLQKDKVGEKGAVTYTNGNGDLVTSTPLLVELGRASATPKLFTKTKSTTDVNEVTLDSMTDGTSGFYSFSAEKPLDVYYGLHFEGEKREWVNVLQRYAYGKNGDGWELPENDAGYQRYTGLPDDEGRRLGWSSDRVDIAKVRYTLSMQTKSQ